MFPFFLSGSFPRHRTAAHMKCLTCLAAFCFTFLLAAVTTAFAAEDDALVEAKAPRILMIEASTGTVLLSRGVDIPFNTGSLAKLMTVEVALNALERGEISAEATYPVSHNAWQTGGAPSGTTTMFAQVRSSIPVADLLRGIIVQNANDGCIALAEGMAGSEAAFAARMNERAKTIGLSASRFGNSTGLPTQESVTTINDILRLARHIEETYPSYFPLYAQPDFEWGKIRQRNKNPLVGVIDGILGFSAGYAEKAGFGLVATARRGDTRLYLAMSGLASEKERRDEAVRLFEWGFSSFSLQRVFTAGTVVGAVKIYGGATDTLSVKPNKDVLAYVPNDAAGKVTADITYQGPVKAPVESGQEIGMVRILAGDTVLHQAPVYANEAVAAGPLKSRASDALKTLIFGH